MCNQLLSLFYHWISASLCLRALIEVGKCFGVYLWAYVRLQFMYVHLCACVGVCVCVWCACTCVYVYGGQKLTWMFSFILHLTFWDKAFQWIYCLSIDQPDWPTSFGDSLVSLPTLQLSHYALNFLFKYGLGTRTKVFEMYDSYFSQPSTRRFFLYDVASLLSFGLGPGSWTSILFSKIKALFKS